MFKIRILEKEGTNSESRTQQSSLNIPIKLPHRYPGADQPQEIVPEVLLRFWGRDISGEHARMRFDPGG